MFKYTSISLLFFFLFSVAVAQKKVNIKDSIVSAPIIGSSYCPQLPAGDMVNRFGFNSNIGVHFIYKTDKNWMWSANWNFIFGKVVKENNILAGLTTSDDMLINDNGEPADIRFYERGQFYGASVGKLIYPLGPNPNSGFFVSAGPGFLMHKIRIEDIGNTASVLKGDYKKGYDRLTFGAAFQESIGYMLLSNNRFLNIYACADFTQGFTKNQRGYNFDTQQYDNTRRLDVLHGFRIGFLLPIYQRTPDEFYYN